ncbi:MAG: SIS domain-containing protein [Christensenella sp.]|uniref:KpsF/GutQ family sugar-phosphate isomerase n=1 Tax=Christensenella sp. TaxID=1935934 RepID=UPI002B1FCCC3|nr:SIS domain-containing protein [Christensenella sp.]MEA5002369.1 SIS domain-containing protein [Christensenella sp.]
MNNIIEECKGKIKAEADALYTVAEQVDSSYVEAIDAIMNSKGRLIITGLGKTGHIGKKIAASFASLGIPAYFVHSCESLHGDMGMITKKDVVIMLSNSGKSQEILNMLPPLKIIGATTISITKGKDTPLAQGTDIAICANAGSEIDHMGLAPTTSSTAALAVGDALATVISALKGFRKEDFALSHPGGALGQKLLKEYQERVNKA